MPNELIADKEVIETPGLPTQRATIKADSTKEFLASGYNHGWQNYANTLPDYIDDVTAFLGSELYERMMFDACVSSQVETIRDGVLDVDLIVSPAVGEEKDGYAQALEISNACKRMVDSLETPVECVLQDVFRGIVFGNRVAEKVYKVQGNALNLIAVKVKPREVFSFVVDAYKNILGFVGLRPGMIGGYGAYGYGNSFGLLPLQDLATGDNGVLPTLLPRSKFAVYTHGMQDGDPRGTSILRSAYEAWYFKTQMWPELMKFLTQFAGPSLIALMKDGGSVGEYLRNPQTGLPILDTLGNPILLTAVQAAINCLSQIRNGAAGAMAGVEELVKIQSEGSGEAFHNAFQMFDQQISIAITGQSLTGAEGRHGATSAGADVHQDVLGRRVVRIKRDLAQYVRREWFRDWVILNYGENLAWLTPKTSLMAPEQQDEAAIWTAAAALFTAGAVQPSQMQKFYQQIGMPQISPEDLALLFQQAQLGLQTAQAGLETAKNPPQPGQNSKANKASE